MCKQQKSKDLIYAQDLHFLDWTKDEFKEADNCTKLSNLEMTSAELLVWILQVSECIPGGRLEWEVTK